MKHFFAASTLLCLLLLVLFGPQITLPYYPENVVTQLPVILPVPAGADTLSGSVALPVAPLLQLPELPNGCEATSLAMVLRYFGCDADKLDIATNYLPCTPIVDTAEGLFGPNPYHAFAGEPTETTRAYYCYAPPVVATANRYLTLRGLPAAAYDISGAAQEVLQYHLTLGTPVILWATLEFMEPYQRGIEWTMPNGEVHTAYSNLHCYVLTGYDSENFYLADPILGEVSVDAATLIARYEAVGSHAAIVNLQRDAVLDTGDALV